MAIVAPYSSLQGYLEEAEQQYELAPSSKLRQWLRVCFQWDKWGKRRRRLKRLMVNGVHPLVRVYIWCVLSDIGSLKTIAQRTYSSCLSAFKDIDKKENENGEFLKNLKYEISLDVGRTFPEMDFFKEGRGAASLERVLLAVGCYHGEVGYCQGMGFVAGTMLANGVQEEDVFWIMHRLLQEDFYLKNYHIPSLFQARVDIEIFKILLEKKQKRMFNRMKSLGLSVELFAVQWFVTAYQCVFCDDTMSLIVMDFLLLMGKKFMFQLGLSLCYSQRKLLRKTDTLEEAVKLLQSDCLRELNLPIVLRKALRIRLRRKAIAKLDEIVKRDFNSQ